MVFVHEIDPSYGGKDVQEKLNEIHSGNKEEKEITDELLKSINQKFPHNAGNKDVNGHTVYRC